jgi:hypothetical protein
MRPWQHERAGKGMAPSYWQRYGTADVVLDDPMIVDTIVQ